MKTLAEFAHDYCLRNDISGLMFADGPTVELYCDWCDYKKITPVPHPLNKSAKVIRAIGYTKKGKELFDGGYTIKIEFVSKKPINFYRVIKQ